MAIKLSKARTWIWSTIARSMAAAVEVSSRPDRAPAVSDSDNDDRPDKEPEFVIHIVDDQPPAPAPAPTPLWPPPVLRRPAVPPALPAAPQVDDLDGPQVVHCGRTGLIIKVRIYGIRLQLLDIQWPAGHVCVYIYSCESHTV